MKSAIFIFGIFQMTLQQRSFAYDISLFLIAVIIFDVIVGAFVTSSGEVSLFKNTSNPILLVAFVHIGSSLYAGNFDRRRTISWLLFIVSIIVPMVFGFLGYVLPYGQIEGWLATIFLPLFEQFPSLFDMLRGLPLLSLYILLAIPSILLVFDITMSQRGRWWDGAWKYFLGLILSAAICAFVLRLAISPSIPTQETLPLNTPDRLTPSWDMLPFYSMMRLTTDKLLGVFLLFAPFFALLPWPWMRAETFLRDGLRWGWFTTWLMFILAFIGLGYLGAQIPSDQNIMIARALAIYYFAFLLMIPVIFRYFSRK